MTNTPLSSVPLSTLGISTGSDTRTAKKDSPAEIQKVASQFEALLMGEILKSARPSDGSGWFGAEEESDSGLSEMAEQQLSQALAARGGLGLSSFIEKGLRKAEPASKNDATPVVPKSE